MIARITGALIDTKDMTALIDVQGVCYEILVPTSILSRLAEAVDANGRVSLIIYDYIQLSPAKGNPTLVGFLNAIERDFFLDFIKVSGIGPRAAVKALDQPISVIADAIARGDAKFLQSLPGIGQQKAKEIVAKLQNKVGKYGLIQDQPGAPVEAAGSGDVPAWQTEALDVLLQLQYKKAEALRMIEGAIAHTPGLSSAEDLLNEIYKQRIVA